MLDLFQFPLVGLDVLPKALGRLRRAQTFLRMLDIEIVFGREGRSGARMIRLSVLGQSRSRANGMDCDEGLKAAIA